MSPKRLLWLLFVVGWVIVGFTRPGEAQHRRSVVVVGGYYGYPYYGGYPYYASPFWYGYPWFPYASPYGPYPYYGYYGYESSVRLEVTPKEAEVYVDGYYAGIVDDFDGTFQRLRVARGEHELTVYRDGYRPFRQKVYLGAGSTFKVKQALEALAPGESAEPRPTPPPPPPDAEGPEPAQPPAPSRGSRQPPPPVPNQGAPRPGDTSTSGALVIRVQPENASVLIDGEPWEGPRGQERLIVQVSEGMHHVEVRRDGYETFSVDVTVRRGETTPLNVSLRAR